MFPTKPKQQQYRVIIEEIDADEPKSLEFSYQDREDVFNIIEKLKKGSGLEPESATQVAVALRLLGPVMMKDRKHPLFADFAPHFKSFMHNLKSTVKESMKAQ